MAVLQTAQTELTHEVPGPTPNTTDFYTGGVEFAADCTGMSVAEAATNHTALNDYFNLT